MDNDGENNNPESTIQAGDFLKTEFTIYHGQNHVADYLQGEGLSYEKIIIDKFETLNIPEGQSLVFSYKGKDFVFKTNSESIKLTIPEGTEILENDGEIYRIKFNEDQAITQVDGENINLSDIDVMLENGVSLNQARQINGLDRVADGVLNTIDLGEFRDNMTTVTGLVIGINATLGSTYLAKTFASEVFSLDSPTDKLREVFVREFSNGVLRGMGRAVPKVAGSILGKHIDAGIDIIKNFTDEEKSYYEATMASIDDVFEEYVETRVDNATFKVVEKITPQKLINMAEAASDFAGRAGNKAVTYSYGKASSLLSKYDFKLKPPISEDVAIAARNETRRLMEAAKQEAIELAQKSNMSKDAAEEAGRRAYEATEKASFKATKEAMKRGDNVSEITKSIRSAAGEVTEGLGKIIKKVTEASEVVKNTTVVQKISKPFKALSSSRLGRATRFLGKGLGKFFIVGNVVMDGADGAMTLSEGYEDLEVAKLTTDNQQDDKKAKAKIANGYVKTGLATGAAVSAGVAVTTAVAGGATIGGGILAAGALATNPVGWAIGGALLVNYGVKYFTGKSLTERATNWAFGVDENPESEKKNEAEKQQSNQPIGQAKEKSNGVSQEVQERLNIEVPAEIAETFRKVAMDKKIGANAIIAVNKELNKIVSVKGTEFESNPMVDYNIPGQITVKATFAKSEEAGIALIKTMTGLEGEALDDAVAQAKIEMNKTGNEGQAFFRDIRSQSGFKERMVLGMPEVIASTVADNNEYDMMASNLEKNGQTVAADTIRQLAIQTEPNFTPFIDPSLLEYQSVPESLVVRNPVFTDEIDFQKSKSLPPAING